MFNYRGFWKRQPVSIVRTRCNYGGSRPWFKCLCGRRAGLLFDGVGAFVCRLCLGLAYACQQENARWRPLLRAQAIRRRLGGSSSLLDPFPERPPRMHQRTYERLRRKAMEAERQAISLAAGTVHRLGLAVAKLE